MAADMAYGEALRRRALEGFEPPAANLQPQPRCAPQRQDAGAGWPLRGFKEQLAGDYLIEVPDLDPALSWAAPAPAPAMGWSNLPD